MTAREFELRRGKSKKFWRIERVGSSYTLHFGREGTTGQKRGKQFPNERKAKLAYVKSILKKIEEGYVEVNRPCQPEEKPELKDLPGAGDLLLHAIEIKCSEKQLRFLLENGVNANAKRDGGVSALDMAVFYRLPNMVRLLLEHGADAKGKDWQGRPLLIAAGDTFGKPQQAVIDLLVEYGARKDLNADLYLEGAKKVIEKIKRNPKLIEELDDPIELMNNAIEKKSPELVELLLDLGIDPNAHGRRHPPRCEWQSG